MRFHLVDRIEEIRHGAHVTGVKCVTLADDVFDEHFPGFPVFPGSLILEGLAQLAGSFFEITMKERGLPPRRAVLAIVNRLKLRRPVGPGDRLVYRADILAMGEEHGQAKVAATLEGEPVADGELTFSFVVVDNEALQRSREALYDICTRQMRVLPP